MKKTLKKKPVKTRQKKTTAPLLNTPVEPNTHLKMQADEQRALGYREGWNACLEQLPDEDYHPHFAVGFISCILCGASLWAALHVLEKFGVFG